ncbi:MAG TPA: hypothetical protein VMS21_06965 [Methylomirabilota bacterium]|nr:hypothetical protein [Methylomirabilota bacterium]
MLPAFLFCQWLATAAASEIFSAGPLHDRFEMTLDPGVQRTEIAGPLFYRTEAEHQHQWALPPLLSRTVNLKIDSTEFDFLYPILTYDRYGTEYRLQLLQWLSFSGGETLDQEETDRFTLFPFYFQQRSDNPDRNYTALFPLYGTLKNRLLRDEIEFVLWPLYAKTVRGRSMIPGQAPGPREYTTYNYLYPVFHVRRGENLRGWQVWPLAGHETRTAITHTNHWGDPETLPGHRKLFILWPFYFNQRADLGTDDPKHLHALLPFYSRLRSPQRDSTTIPWPLGLTITQDREKKYTEVGAPWPLIVFTRGEGKHTSRVWPFFSRSGHDTLQSDWYFWPVYKYNRIQSDPLDRERTRILFFLYSDLIERNTATGTALHRRDLWPLFTYREDHQGKERLQILSLLEPLLPGNRGIERNWSPLWSLWRSERNPQTSATSQSLLWNLYRRETSPDLKKCSLLFGLFQYQSGSDGRRWRVFYLPFGRSENEPDASRSP